jgi:hypothetical protein
MMLLRDKVQHKKMSKLKNTDKGMSKVYDNKLQKFQEKLMTLEEEKEHDFSRDGGDRTYMV